MNKGDFVDMKTGQEKWHGIVARISGSQATVMWLESDSRNDANSIKGRQYSIPYFRGYTTIEETKNLVACDKHLQHRRHPSSNPWGRKYGVAN
jgi:hypothetical protein